MLKHSAFESQGFNTHSSSSVKDCQHLSVLLKKWYVEMRSWQWLKNIGDSAESLFWLNSFVVVKNSRTFYTTIRFLTGPYSLFWLVSHLWVLCNVSFHTWFLVSFLKVMKLIQYLCMWLHLHWIQFYIGTWNFILYLCNYCCYHSCVSGQIQCHELHIHLCCCNSGQSQ